jgi:hypothetical protein
MYGAKRLFPSVPTRVGFVLFVAMVTATSPISHVNGANAVIGGATPIPSGVSDAPLDTVTMPSATYRTVAVRYLNTSVDA